jgi:hypothetical protein
MPSTPREYCDPPSHYSLTHVIHAPPPSEQVRDELLLDQSVFEDAERGKLPTSSFIEPQIIGWNHNDMHRARLDRLSHHISPRELGLTPDQIFDTNDDAVRALAPSAADLSRHC